MGAPNEKRPCNCRCNCRDNSDDSVRDKKYISANILGNTHNSVDLWVSTPSQTKWKFVEETEEEMKDERQRIN